MLDYTTVNKKKLVDSFTDTALKALQALSWQENSDDGNRVPRELALVMQELNVLAKNLNLLVSENFISGKFYEPGLYVDNELERVMRQKLKEMLQLIMEILSDINTILSTGVSEENQIATQKAIGRLLMMLRFDILSLPEDIIEGAANMGNVYAQFSRLGALNGDHFMVRHMWHCSARRFLPEYFVDDTAIVLQGPVKYDGNFTLETLFRYRRIYPDIKIVLSTWEGEVTEDFRLLADSIGIDILENAKPEDGGPWHIRYQLLSSLEGLKSISGSKIKYAMKTRTDQVFLFPDFIIYIKNMLKTFPVNCAELTERIVFLGAYNSMCTYPFRITDFMAFGALEDLIAFYQAPADAERLKYTSGDKERIKQQYLDVLSRSPYENYSSMISMDEEARKDVVKMIGGKQDPESYLIQSFYERVIYGDELSKDEDVLLHYWKFIKNCALIIDADDLFLIWEKYGYQYMNLSSNVSDGGLTHAVWLSVYYSELI